MIRLQQLSPRLALWLLLLGLPLFTMAQPGLFKDLNPGAGGSSPYGFTEIGGVTYFTATDGTSGAEVWTTDGTPAGTSMLSDLNPGSGSLSPSDFTDVNGTVFFRGSGVGTGAELWKTDGTPGGSSFVKDIRPGTASSNPYSFLAAGGLLFFGADDGSTGQELWRSDGTSAGTFRLTDINVSGSSGINNFYEVNGLCLHMGYTPANQYSLNRSDGTIAGSYELLDLDPTSSTQLSGGFVFNNNLYFRASNGGSGFELWKSDGTAGGTVLVKDINPGSGHSSPQGFTEFNGELYFRANDGTNGYELWKTDGTALGTVMVKDINVGVGNSSPGNFGISNGELYFSASDGTNGNELWKTDGTGANTIMVADLNPGAGPISPRFMTEMNGELFFIGQDASNLPQLFKTDGTAAGSSQLSNYALNNSGYDTYVSDLITDGNNLVWVVNEEDYFNFSSQHYIWSSDGTAAGTAELYDAGSGYLGNLKYTSGKIFFSGYDASNGSELWVVNPGPPAPPTPTDLTFVVGTEESGPNNTVTIPVKVGNFNNVVNYQGTIVFDPAVLTFNQATSPQTGGPVVINSFGNPGVGNVPTNSLTFFWYDLTALPQILGDSTIVINLEFTVNANATTGFTPISIDGSVTPLGYSDDPNGIVLLTPTVQNGGVNIDADPPVTTAVNIVSNNANDITLATVADVITLSFTTDETPAITPVVTITKGGAGAITVTGSGTTWTATKTVAAGDDGLVTFDIELEDQYGNTSNTTATTDGSSVTVDTEVPVITCPANVPQNTDAGLCSADVTYSDATATDNLAGVSVAHTGGPVSGSTFPVGTTAITYVATDAAGNTSTCSFDVIVTDNEAPTVVTQPVTVQLDAAGSASVTAAQVDNGSSDACGIASTSLDITSFDCSNTGANTVTLTVTDNNGNVSTGTAVVTVEDNIAPTIVCPGPQTLDTDLGLCTATLPDLTALTTASDNCAGSGGSNGYSTYASTVSVGYQHTVAIAADGTLWAWGKDNGGQVGDGPGVTSNQFVPVQISTDNSWIAVSAGNQHNLALKSDGTVWAWGFGGQGQLGNSSTANQFSPVQVGSDTDWALIKSGHGTSFGIKSNGTLWAWGENTLGQLGIGNAIDQSSPVQVGTTTDWLEVQGGLNHTIGVKTDGTLWTWGNNYYGQLGTGSGNSTSPVQVGSATDWAAVEAAYYHSIALKSDGTIWTWGSNQQGQLGIGNTNNQSSPVQVGSATDWTSLGVAYTGCYALKSNGSLWAWGARIYGAIGDGNTSGIQTTPIQMGVNTNWTSIADGHSSFSTLAFQSDGSLYGWGWNTNGQLGLGNATFQPTPVVVPGFVVSQASNSGGSGSGPALTQLPAAGSALAVGANTVTITATDASGNQTSCTVIVTVEDNEAPTVVMQPFTVQLDASGNGSIDADDVDNGSSDPCGIATRTLDISTFDCSNVGTPVTVTMTVTDVNGNVSTGTAVVTVEDNVAPTVVTQPYTVQLDAAGNGSIVVGDVNNGSSDACGIASTALDITNFDCSHVGANTVTLTVTDVNGNVATGTAVVTVEDNVAPTVVTQPFTAQLDATGNVTITPADVNNGSSDACGIASTSLDITSLDCSNIGTNIVTLTVTDNNGNVSTGTAVVTVEDNIAPMISCPAPVTILTSSLGAGYTLTGGDQFYPLTTDLADVNGVGNDVNVYGTNTQSADGICFPVSSATGATPNYLTVTPTSSWDPTDFRFSFDVKPEDFDTRSFQNGALLSSMFTGGSSGRWLSVSALPDGTVGLEYNNQFQVLSSTVINLSDWHNFEVVYASGVATLSMDGNQILTQAITFDPVFGPVNDKIFLTRNQSNGGHLQGCIRNISINGTPVVSGSGGGSSCQAAVALAATATDNCGPVTITDNAPAMYTPGITTVTFTAIDPSGNSSQCSVDVTVIDDVAPTVSTQPITVQLDASGNGSVTAAQVDDGSSDACGIQSLALDITTFDCSNVGTPVTVTMTVTDVNGNSATGTAVVTVEDNVDPTVVTQPYTVQLDAAGNGSIVVADVNNGSSDACGIASTSLDITSFDCSNVGANTVTLTVTDVNGNVSTGTAVVTVEDNVNPVAVAQAISVDLDGNGTATITPAQIDNGSSDACGIATYALDVTSFDCNTLGANTVTLTVTDNNGNTHSATAVVTVNLVPAAAITGQAATEDNKVVAGVTFDVNGTDGPLTQLGSPAYSFLLTPCTSVNDIGGFKNNDADPKNGVDVQDITKMTRHILNIEALGSPYKLLAADVNHNSLINGPDVTQVRQMVLGVRTGFPTPGATVTNPVTDDYLWSFIPQAHTWVDNTIPWTYPTRIDFLDPVNASGQDFVGVKLGDVNNTWDETNPLTTWFADSIHMVMQDQATAPGQLVTIPVMVRDFNAITGYQFTMNWDPSVLSLESAENVELLGFFNTELAKKGILSTVWNDLAGQPITMEDDAVAFTLTFRVVGDWGSTSGITVTSDLTNAIGYNVEEMPLAVIASTVNITVGDVSTSIDPSELEGYAFLQNVPNPFNESTTFTFALPTQEDVKIEIYNGLGQIVRTFEGTYGVGAHEVEWNGTNSASREVAQGIYSVRIQAGLFQSAINVKKMQ